MKYIRTKERIYEVKDKETDICILTNRGWIYKSEIIKQADTIEELCDEFVFEMGLQHNICQLTFEQVRDNILNCELENMSYLYGAIWCEWGLKYVAKMNGKGELCLI